MLSALVSEDAIALALAVSEGSLEAYIKYDRMRNGSGASDFLSDSIVAACILADANQTLVTAVSDCGFL